MLHPVLGNITDNTDMVLKIEGRVHRKDKSVRENEHTVKKNLKKGCSLRVLHSFTLRWMN